MSDPAPRPGQDDARWRRWVALAGALGEAGVGEAVLVDARGVPTRLTTRETDLPGVLSGAAPGSRLLAETIDLEVLLTPGGPRWGRVGSGDARRAMEAVEGAG